MRILKFTLILFAVIAFCGLNEADAQWNASGNNIYNTNTANVGIGNSSPTTLLHVAKNMTEPAITVQNLGGAGGATYVMNDIASGANWKFKATNTGGFKIRDHANSLDVVVIEPNSSANVLYINGAGSLGIRTATPAASAAVEISSTDKGFLMPRLTLSQIQSISTPANGLQVFCTTDGKIYIFVGNENQWKEVAYGTGTISPIPVIGQNYQGGIVFYIDGTGQHGLIAATSDQSTASPYGCYGYSTPGTSTAIGTGQASTTAIVNACGEGNIAARVCNDLVLNTYSDWYLPSRDELVQMFLQKDAIGGFTTLDYWSSSEIDPTSGWQKNFAVDGSTHMQYKGNPGNVRAIRAF